MSISNSAGIVTSGLVFSYDMSSPLSYKGPVMTNLLKQITPRGLGGNGINYSGVQGTENVYIPTLGEVTTKWVDIMNDYNNVYGTGGTGDCCPSMYGYGDSIAVSGSTLYTYGILYKSTTGYTHPNYMYHYEYSSSGYLTEYGLHTTANRTHLGDNWYWAWNTFTSQSTATIFHTGLWHYEYYTRNRIYVAKVLLAAGNWTGVHPKYWPDVNTSRSSTQAIVDIFGGNTITANNLVYNADGTFYFNNSSSYLSIPNSSAFNFTAALSIEALVKFDGDSDDFIFEKGDVNTQYSLFSHGSDIVFRTMHAADGGSYHTQNPAKSTVGVTNGQWVHIVGSWDGTTKRIYINGELKDSVAKSGALVTTSKGSSVGRFGGDTAGYFFGGSIAKVAVYNIGLTEAQVRQNFNSIRGRYGL